MELTHNNPKINDSYDHNNGRNDKRNSDVLSAEDRELLLLVTETYTRIQGGQVKSRRKS